MSIFNEIIPFFRKINPKKGVAQIVGSGSPEGSAIGYEGQTYRNTDNNALYEKAIGNGTNTGWSQKTGAGASVPDATEIQAGKVELATTLEAETGSDDSNKAMNPLKTKQAFDKFLPQFGTTSGTITQGNDGRLLVKRLKILIGGSTTQTRTVSFNYGTTISNPSFESTMTSDNNDDAFIVKIVNITTTSADIKTYRANGTNWGDNTVSVFVTIYSGTY